MKHIGALPPIVAAFLALAGAPLAASAKDGDVTATFLATPTKPAFGEVGHAFLCIGVETAGGLKEDCFGFYPQSLKDVLNGKGKIERELSRKEKPERFSQVTTSLSVEISPETRQKIYQELEKWGGKDYALLSNNCGDMVFAIAKAAGIPLPGRSSVTTPTEFVNGLKMSVDYQTSMAADAKKAKEADLQRRQLESGRAAAEQVQQAQRQREQIDAARKAVEQAETARKATEQAEAARKALEQAESARKAAAAAEQARQQAEAARQAADRARQQAEAAQRAAQRPVVIPRP